MTLEESLKANGLTQEKIVEILETMKTNGVYTTDVENAAEEISRLNEELKAAGGIPKEGSSTEPVPGENEGASKEPQLPAGTANKEPQPPAGTANKEFQLPAGDTNKEVERLKQENLQLKAEYEVREALLHQKVKDVEYILYKLQKQGGFEFDEDGKVKELDTKIEQAKVDYPEQFTGDSSDSGRNGKEVNVKKWQESHQAADLEPETLEEAVALHYKEK